jgi:hypothetical protein
LGRNELRRPRAHGQGPASRKGYAGGQSRVNRFAAGSGTRQARSAPSSCWTPSTYILEGEIPGWRATCAGRVREQGARLPGGRRHSGLGPESSVLDGPSRAYNGLEMSRLAGAGKAAWAGASYAGSVRPPQVQLQGMNTPGAWLELIGGRWQRDPAGQVGSIELLDAQYLLPRA